MEDTIRVRVPNQGRRYQFDFPLSYPATSGSHDLSRNKNRVARKRTGRQPREQCIRGSSFPSRRTECGQDPLRSCASKLGRLRASRQVWLAVSLAANDDVAFTRRKKSAAIAGVLSLDYHSVSQACTAPTALDAKGIACDEAFAALLIQRVADERVTGLARCLLGPGSSNTDAPHATGARCRRRRGSTDQEDS
jgi:hypothetical protein